MRLRIAATVIPSSASGGAGPGRRRTVHARDFFLAPLTTVLAPDELLLAAHFPAATPGDGFAFAELSRRHGDYALTGVAVRVTHTPSGEVQEAVLAAFGVSSRPVVIDITNHLTAALSALPQKRPRKPWPAP